MLTTAARVTRPRQRLTGLARQAAGGRHEFVRIGPPTMGALQTIGLIEHNHFAFKMAVIACNLEYGHRFFL
jgi:hypothetical protein